MSIQSYSVKSTFLLLSPADLSLAMFKSGDDLRQDSFVLQMVEVMNRIWLLSGQDYRIITFNVVTTGDRQGKFVVVVVVVAIVDSCSANKIKERRQTG